MSSPPAACVANSFCTLKTFKKMIIKMVHTFFIYKYLDLTRHKINNSGQYFTFFNMSVPFLPKNDKKAVPNTIKIINSSVSILLQQDKMMKI